MNNIHETAIVTFILACGLIVWTSCKKGEDVHGPAPNSATITVASPLSGSTYSLNDTVHIDATIVAQQDIHGYQLFLRRMPDSLVLYFSEADTHATNIAIHEEWINLVSTPTDVQLELIVTLDHEGNIARRTVDFHCNP